MGAPPTEGRAPDGAPLTALGPLLVPGTPPDAQLDDAEQAEGTDAASGEPEPAPGGDLGAAVAAALQAALERTGELPPNPTAPAPPASTPPAAEPLDLLDTSTAPWLTDPELGVQWAESWIASHPGETEPPAPEPVAEVPPISAMNVAPVPAVPPPAAPPAATPPPAASVGREVASAPEAAPATPLPPRTYEPRSLERLLRAEAPSPAPRPVVTAVATVPASDAVEEVPPPPAPRRLPLPHQDWGVAVAAGLMIGLLAGLVAYAFGPATHDVHLTRYVVPVNDLPASLEGLRVVQVSDLHLPGSVDVADSAASLVATAKPDVLLLTGDILDDASPAALAALDRFLGTAKGARGTFAIAGEREAGIVAPLRSAYEKRGVRLLENERVTLEVGPAHLVIAEVDGPATSALPLRPVVATTGVGAPARPADRPRAKVEILMVHAPQQLGDVPRADLKGAAFVVSGHTLGGTLGLPSILSASRYRSGWYSLDVTQLYVSNGVGTGRLHARLLAPAEVTRFTLRRAQRPYETPVRDTIQ